MRILWHLQVQQGTPIFIPKTHQKGTPRLARCSKTTPRLFGPFAADERGERVESQESRTYQYTDLKPCFIAATFLLFRLWQSW